MTDTYTPPGARAPAAFARTKTHLNVAFTGQSQYDFRLTQCGGANLEHQERIRRVASLVTQMGFATLLFLVIGLLAVIVHVGIAFCRVHDLAPSWMIGGTEVLAIVMWIFDVVCFGLFMFSEVIDFWKSMVGRAR